MEGIMKDTTTNLGTQLAKRQFNRREFSKMLLAGAALGIASCSPLKAVFKAYPGKFDYDTNLDDRLLQAFVQTVVPGCDAFEISRIFLHPILRLAPIVYLGQSNSNHFHNPIGKKWFARGLRLTQLFHGFIGEQSSWQRHRYTPGSTTIMLDVRISTIMVETMAGRTMKCFTLMLRNISQRVSLKMAIQANFQSTIK